MTWSREQTENHLKGAEKLDRVRKETFEFLKKGVSEEDTRIFVLKKYKKYGLKTNMKRQIIAFNESSAVPHYNPKKNPKKLEKNSVILIDLWARLSKKNSPFVDITWLGFFGEKIPKDVKRAFKVSIDSRNAGIETIKKNPDASGAEIDNACNKVIFSSGFGKNILHKTGHSLGFHSPHGIYPGINSKNKEPLIKRIGYAIEPGIYFKENFGMRSELNLLIDKNLEITTEIQKKIILI